MDDVAADGGRRYAQRSRRLFVRARQELYHLGLAAGQRDLGGHSSTPCFMKSMTFPQLIAGSMPPAVCSRCIFQIRPSTSDRVAPEPHAMTMSCPSCGIGAGFECSTFSSRSPFVVRARRTRWSVHSSL